MHTRSTTIIAAGVIVSFLGIVSVIAYGRSVERRSAGGSTVAAYTASSDIPAGTSGAEAARSMRRVSVPKTVRPSTAVSDPAQIDGRIAVRSIATGEVVTTTQFGTTATTPASGLEIPPGYNAVSVNLPSPQGVAHYAGPGDIVNVYVTLKADGDPKGPGAQTKLILSNVQVLSDQTPGAKAGPGGTGEVLLTLALQPKDAEKLIFAKETGSVWFGLVRPGDAPAATVGQSSATVLR